MSGGYRRPLPPCPFCGGVLQDRPAADAIVDVCAECNAVWIDWFDGDLSTVVRDVRVDKIIPKRVTSSHPCPRCQRELHVERLYDRGPDVYRCGECAGVLVPSAVLDEVAALEPPGDKPEAGPIARAIAALRRVFTSET